MNVARRLYEELKNGDVYQNWCRYIQFTQVPGADESDSGQNKRKSIVSLLIMIWSLSNMIRYVSSGIWETEVPHLYGHTMANTDRLFAVAAGIWFLHSVSFRLVTIRLASSGSMVFLKTVRSMTQDGRKEKLARILLIVAVVLSILVIVAGFLVFTAAMCINIIMSDSWLSVCLWIVWYVVDMLNLVTSCDGVTMDVMWILVVLNYRMDMADLMDEASALTDSLKRRKTGRITRRNFDKVQESYVRLTRHSVGIDQMAASFLFVITFCTTPIVCSTIFIITYSYNLYLVCAVAIGLAVVGGLASTLLLIAGRTTHTILIGSSTHWPLSLVAVCMMTASRCVKNWTCWS